MQALFVYPIKGCQGIPLKSAAVTPTGGIHAPPPPPSPFSHSPHKVPPRTTRAGLPYDRQWMVVREATGKFVTQRQIPKLCKVSASLPPEALMGQSWGVLQPGAAMVLSAPGMPQLQVPLTDPSASTANTRYGSLQRAEWVLARSCLPRTHHGMFALLPQECDRVGMVRHCCRRG